MYGGLATTRNGRCGSRTVVASARTTVTGSSANRCRSNRHRSGCNSTATTRAPAATRCPVRAPWPAPRSSTNSPGRTSAAATMRAAQPSASSCQPHDRRVGRRPPGCGSCRPSPPDTADHHHESAHRREHKRVVSSARTNYQPHQARTCTPERVMRVSPRWCAASRCLACACGRTPARTSRRRCPRRIPRSTIASPRGPGRRAGAARQARPPRARSSRRRPSPRCCRAARASDGGSSQGHCNHAGSGRGGWLPTRRGRCRGGGFCGTL